MAGISETHGADMRSKERQPHELVLRFFDHRGDCSYGPIQAGAAETTQGNYAVGAWGSQGMAEMAFIDDWG